MNAREDTLKTDAATQKFHKSLAAAIASDKTANQNTYQDISCQSQHMVSSLQQLQGSIAVMQQQMAMMSATGLPPQQQQRHVQTSLIASPVYQLPPLPMHMPTYAIPVSPPFPQQWNQPYGHANQAGNNMSYQPCINNDQCR